MMRSLRAWPNAVLKTALVVMITAGCDDVVGAVCYKLLQLAREVRFSCL